MEHLQWYLNACLAFHGKDYNHNMDGTQFVYNLNVAKHRALSSETKWLPIPNGAAAQKYGQWVH